MATDSRYDERQTALAPYLERLTAPLHPAIWLDPWEQSVLEEALDPDHGNGDRWPTLLAESVALQSKHLLETDELEREECTSPESIEEHRERLRINAAIGLVLMEEIQRVIDATILAGKMGEAKRLTAFRHKLAQTAKAIKERLSAEDYEYAMSMHHEMLAPLQEAGKEKAGTAPALDIDPNEANELPPGTIQEMDEGPPKPIKLDHYANPKLGRAVEEKPNYSKRLLLVLGVAILAWSILVLPRMFREPLAVLTLPDLPQSAAIQAVDAKPPSLYIVVDRNSWNGMPAEQRSQLVEAIGQSAAAAGYTGVNVRTGEGASVAQWLKQKGPRLFTGSGSGS